jgi:hypothetical protein
MVCRYQKEFFKRGSLLLALLSTFKRWFNGLAYLLLWQHGKTWNISANVFREHQLGGKLGLNKGDVSNAEPLASGREGVELDQPTLLVPVLATFIYTLSLLVVYSFVMVCSHFSWWFWLKFLICCCNFSGMALNHVTVGTGRKNILCTSKNLLQRKNILVDESASVFDETTGTKGPLTVPVPRTGTKGPGWKTGTKGGFPTATDAQSCTGELYPKSFFYQWLRCLPPLNI